MRLDQPRIRPLRDTELTEELRDLLAPIIAHGALINVFRTLAHKPKALRGFLPWGHYVLSRGNDLPKREREIIILRTAYRCGSPYEWAQHLRIGRECGLTDAEISRLKKPDLNDEWSKSDRALLQAADELHVDQFISDATWADLRAQWSEAQCMDVVFSVGQYTQVAMMLNSFGVPLDAAYELDLDVEERP